MDKVGLNFSNTGLRHYLGMKKELLNFHCYRDCNDCVLDDEGVCAIDNLNEIFNEIFKEFVL